MRGLDGYAFLSKKLGNLYTKKLKCVIIVNINYK